MSPLRAEACLDGSLSRYLIRVLRAMNVAQMNNVKYDTFGKTPMVSHFAFNFVRIALCRQYLIDWLKR